jgi:uncharacterized membrane protein (UPF0127 family)
MSMTLQVIARAARSAFPILVAASVAACGDGSVGEAAEARAAGPGNTASRVAGSQSAESGVTEAPRPARGTAWVVFGTAEEADTVVAEIAQTPGERAQGLMYREELGEDEGMLFVFQDVEERAFWMENTYIPLDIAYMDPSFRIIDIKPMEPESAELVESSGPAQYALEVNRGWFEEHGVTVGATPRVFFGM